MNRHWRYLKLVLRHKLYVFIAGRKVGYISLWRLLIHDWTKFTPAEWNGYVNRFMRGDAGKFDKSDDPDEWHRAWNHHWHNNPHHWEYWIGNLSQSQHDGDLAKFDELEMPLHFANEMVADWMGASKAYTGSWDISAWYNKNRDRMILHPDTRAYVELVIHSVNE